MSDKRLGDKLHADADGILSRMIQSLSEQVYRNEMEDREESIRRAFPTMGIPRDGAFRLGSVYKDGVTEIFTNAAPASGGLYVYQEYRGTDGEDHRTPIGVIPWGTLDGARPKP